MNDVVYAFMVRDKTSQQRIVRRIDDGIRVQPRYVSLPEGNVFFVFKGRRVHDPVFRRFGLKEFVLYFEETGRDGVGKAFVEISPDQIPLDFVRIAERGDLVALFEKDGEHLVADRALLLLVQDPHRFGNISEVD